MLKRLLNLFNKSSKKRFIVKGDITRIKIGSKTIIDSTVIFNNERGGTIEIGDNCRIYENVILATYGGDIKIGNHSSINPFCVLYGHGGLTIGNELRMATHSIIIPANHIYKDIEVPIRLQGIEKKGVTIEDNVWIGAGVKILDGVVISKNSIIAAGAVVNKKVEKNSIVGGVPAKLIKNR
jgi:acetyltransferase-like isoleucine patch superfamily enzyme